ncbi:MAG: hypothetical protein J6S71_05955 [Clostridia bacterium]|nr:hypothetical protein [Clostridia bacterium]
MLILEIVILLCIYGIIAYFCNFSEQKELDRDHEYLHLSRAYFYLGLIGSILFALVAVIVLIFDSASLAIVFFALAILFAFILSGYYGYRIYYDDEKIVYRKYFEKYKAIFYKDIRRVNFEFDIEITAKDSKLTVPCYMANSGALLEKMLKHIPKKATQKIKPQEKVRKFSDSVYRPGEFIFAFILMYILGISFDSLLITVVMEYSWEVWALLGVSVFCYIFPIFAFISAKRAHSSKFWRAVAKLCYKDGYLKVDDTHPRHKDK